MQRQRCRYRRLTLELVASSACALIATPVMAGGWVTYTNETSVRLASSAGLGSADVEEKDYAFGDVDHDGDNDLVSVRKQPWTTAGGRPNVLFMNQGGVLTDQTSIYVPGFLDATNDRDVQLVDVNNDTWLDIVTAAACNTGNCGTASQSRLYLNLGDGGNGTWDGFGSATVLFTGNNYCHVAAGDVTGDNYVDLYFASYEDTLEDHMLINGGPGNPGSFSNGDNRLTAAMRASDFGTSVWIVDMNGDGRNDIVKSENGPAEIFNNNPTNQGFFNILDPIYSAAAYHTSVGDLNNDGKLDIVVSDDGIDRALVNTGNGADGMANFSQVTLPGSTNGFGGNSYIVDLDGDDWRDVVIADVDVDELGCTRVSDILHNVSGTLVADQANIPTATLTGVHDFAIFDINGDGLLDIVVGKCSGTQVWINAPPVELAFTYPDGLPDMVPPSQETDFAITMIASGDTIVPGSERIFISINDGPFNQSLLTHDGGNDYTGTLPSAQCADKLEFYVSAQLSGGLTLTDPAGAPASSYAALAAEGTTLVLEESMETAVGGAVAGWTVTSDPSLTGGEWEAVVPIVTIFNTEVANPAQDATPGGTIAYVTQNPSGAGQPAPNSDIDGGPTYLTSPTLDLEGTDAFVSFAYWVFNNGIGNHDTLVVQLSNDNGASWTQVVSLEDTEGSWSTEGFLVGSYVPPTAQVRVRFVASDNPNDSVAEMAVDDFTVSELSCGGCTHDLDSSGDVGVTDLLDLLGAWGTNPGGPPDFDADGDVGVTDLLALLGAWGPC